MKLVVATLLISSAFAVSAELCTFDYIASHGNITQSELKNAQVICEKCMNQYQVSLDSLQKIETDNTYKPSCSTKCYYKCYFQTYGSMDMEGNWIPGAVSAKMPEKIFQAALSCIGQADSEDLCEKAYKLYSCYVNKINNFIESDF